MLRVTRPIPGLANELNIVFTQPSAASIIVQESLANANVKRATAVHV